MKQLFTTAILILAALDAQALQSGVFGYNDDSQTVIGSYQVDTVSIESNMQVGHDSTPEVPFPTLCRIRQWGQIVKEDSEVFVVRIKILELRDSSSLPKSEACSTYVKNYNVFLSKYQLNIQYHKSSLKKLASLPGSN